MQISGTMVGSSGMVWRPVVLAPPPGGLSDTPYSQFLCFWRCRTNCPPTGDPNWGSIFDATRVMPNFVHCCRSHCLARSSNFAFSLTCTVEKSELV